MTEKTRQKPSHQNNENTLSHPLAVLIRVKLENGAGNGSGFFVQKDLIVTNIHVVALATSISVELVDPKTESIIRTFAVKGVTASDAINDLVVLKIDGGETPLLIGDSDSVKSRDIVQTVGYPNGKFKITDSPIHSIRNYDKWIRLKVKTSGGYSGGPVLNSNEQVIGIAVRSEEIHSLVIPANTLKPILSQSQPEESFTQWQERKQIRAYTQLVQSQINKHRESYDEAIANLDKAAELYPEFALIFYKRGTLKSVLGETNKKNSNEVEAQHHYRDAIDDYTEAIRLCPDFAESYNNRANAKRLLGISGTTSGNRETMHYLNQAAIDSNTAIKLEPNKALFYHTRGEIKYAFGDYCAAIDDYEKALEIDPNYTDVLPDLELAQKAKK